MQNEGGSFPSKRGPNEKGPIPYIASSRAQVKQTSYDDKITSNFNCIQQLALLF